MSSFSLESSLHSFHDRIKRLPEPLALFVSLVAGLCANLGFAPVHAWPIYWLSLILLLWLMDGAAEKEKPCWTAFWRAGAFGFGFFSIGLHWIANAFLVDRESYGHMVWLVGVLIGSLAIFWGGMFGLSVRFWRSGLGRLPVFTFSLFTIEYIRGHMPLGGFPWNIPGMIWSPGGAMSQTASLVGIWGLSAITVFLFAIPACLVGAMKTTGVLSRDSVRALSLFAMVVCLGVMWGWGEHRLARAPEIDPDAPFVRIIDAGVPQKEKYIRSNGARILETYLELTGLEEEGGPEIIIWPEVATPFLLLQSGAAMDSIAGILGQRFLIAGSVRNEPTSGDKILWYNSLAVISGDSLKRGALSIYDKYRRVPFGEYIPFPGVVSRLGVSSIQYLSKNGFQAGLPPGVLPLGEHPSFMPLICYEALFPGLTTDEGERAGWLVNISIDTWFGKILGPSQHFDHARYRSIEEGLPMARAASGGYSGMIDAYGRVTKHGQRVEVEGGKNAAWTATSVDALLPKALKKTGFALGWGKGFAIFFAVFNLWLFVSLRH